MPIYEYHCADCRACFEKRRLMSQADDEIACPKCGCTRTIRGVSQFAAFSKGGGGSSQAVAGSGGCGSCGSHSCSSCKHH